MTAGKQKSGSAPDTLGESTQRALASGLQDQAPFGRNEAPLHDYHNTLWRALGMADLPELE